MAVLKTFETIKVNGDVYQIKPLWQQIGISKDYLVALLGRDEYTPVATKQPVETDTLYTDPDSGNPAGFHAGQCVIYPDADVSDGWGLSIAKQVINDSKGIPVKVLWYHATDIEKRLSALEEKVTISLQGCFGTGKWINSYPWQSDAVWNNGI